jgi:hypothetical protein
VFNETSNIFATDAIVSPLRTTYKLIEPILSSVPEISASVPTGPTSETRALSAIAISVATFFAASGFGITCASRTASFCELLIAFSSSAKALSVLKRFSTIARIPA